MEHYTKPVPRGDLLHGEFWEFCRKHELRFQRCTDCDTWRHMPRESCEKCSSFNWSWERSSGKAKLFSWTIIHSALHPGYAHELPYAAVIVEMDEGVKLVTRLVDIPHDALKLELPLQVEFEDVAEGVTLHAFGLAKD
jgi:uncharacterized protein